MEPPPRDPPLPPLNALRVLEAVARHGSVTLTPLGRAWADALSDVFDRPVPRTAGSAARPARGWCR